MRAHWWGSTFVLAIVLGGATAPCAHAQRTSADVLTWSAPVGCPARDAVASEVDRLLGAHARRDATIRVRARIVRRGTQLELEIETSTPEGEGARTIGGTSCEGLAQAAALVIAMAIDPEAVAANESEAEPEPETEPETDPAPETQPATERANGEPSDTADALSSPRPHVAEPAPEPEAAPPPTTPSTPLDVRFVASAHAILGIGPVPSVSPGAMVSLGVRLGLFSGGALELWASGSFLAEQRARLAEDDPRGGSFGLAAARLRTCLALEAAPPLLELAPCLAVEAGAMWGRGEAVPIVLSGAAPWAALAVGGEARVWVVGPLAITVLAELQIPFVAPTFDLELDGAPRRVHRASDVGAVLGLGALIRLP
ncbi:hypothetical protein [Sandaracinus amylolyticus]|uniref:Uncharacterized protein n=1 Tax=Sandaracinus amylolyticus TaxID=927083 RepID=A0A0F6W2D6_9BACT|nr:hypothetical protein [Sandaracinus amylolyticus]AKF05680.1 hypothetical protein DB32_002829 [Sandaracinus amylolyticus]